MVTHLDGEARTISNAQHGIISRRQALAIGFTDSAIRRRVNVGMWTRVAPGVYSTAGEPTDRSLVAAATIGLPAVASHESAARLLGLRGAPAAPPTVTVPHRLTNRFGGVRVHESTDLAAAWVAEVDGIPTTTTARTIFDLGATLTTAQHTTVAQTAIIDGAVGLEELEGALRALGRRGRPGTVAMREFLEAASDTLEDIESELERRFVQLVRGAGLPTPELQVPLPWRPAASNRVDFMYPKFRLIIEVDGRAWHATSAAFTKDRQRDNAAQLAGYRVLRFTWEDITARPQDVLRQIKAALREPAAA